MTGGGPGERATEDQGVRPPVWAGPVAGLLLGAMVVAFVVPVRFELWPLTSWELFSRPRASEQAGYQVEVVATDGTTSPLPFDRLGRGHRHWRAFAVTLPAATPAERDRRCRSWATAAVGVLGAEGVAEVRVLRVVKRAADRAADPPRIVDRQVLVRCRP